MSVEQVENSRGDGLVVTAVFAVSAAYATVRYNVFKGVPWSDWPHYVGNKILSLAALILIALAVFRLASRPARPIRTLMVIASALAIAHSFISLAMLQPAYYDKFFADGKLTLLAGASLMLASLAVALLQWGKGRRGSSAPGEAALPLGLLGFISGLHAALPSVPGWFEPATWPGGMPPITLISFIVGTLALAAAAKLVARPDLRGLSIGPIAIAATDHPLTPGEDELRSD